MKRQSTVLVFAAMVTFLFFGSPLPAQSSQTQSTGTVQAIVTARARHAAPHLTRKDVIVHEDRQPRPVVSLTPLAGSDSPLQLAIFIDSSSTPRLGAQFDEISRFIQALPPNASIAVAYAMNGGAQMKQNFTTDRAAIRKALHITIGPAAGNTSIYDALSDLIGKWPESRNARREVLLISDGIDLTYGRFDTRPQQNPALQDAIRNAQSARVVVFSIFVSSGRATRNRFLNMNGQGSLSEITSNTGGYSFFQGTQTPVSFRPFLDELQRMLGAQYLLEFRPAPVRRSGYHNLRVTTEVSGVKLLAPKKVYVSAGQ